MYMLKVLVVSIALQIPAAGCLPVSQSSTPPPQPVPLSSLVAAPPTLIVEGKSKFYSYAGELFLSAPLSPSNSPLPSNNSVAVTPALPAQKVRPMSNAAVAVVRLYIMSYFPCGFWPRMITRFLGDETFGKLAKSLYDTSAIKTRSSASWRCWQTGLELIVLGKTVALRVNESSQDYGVHWSNAYRYAHLLVPQEPDFAFSSVDITGMSILEVIVPNETVSLEGNSSRLLYPDIRSAAALMAHAVDRIDTLLEDWYPDIGVRFVQNTKGIYLITRLVPCVRCLLAVQQVIEGDSDTWSVVRVTERGWTPEVEQSINIHSSKNHPVSMLTAGDHHGRSSSVPVRTRSRDKTSSELSSASTRTRPSHRARFQLLFMSE